MKPFIFSVLLFFISIVSSFASPINNQSFFLPESIFENRNYMDLRFNFLNQDIDPFNIIEDELGTITDKSFGAPGEMRGGSAHFYVNIFKNLSADLFSSINNYDFGIDTANISTIESKINFHKKFFHNFVFMVSSGGRYIRSEDLNITGLGAINSMVKRIYPDSSVKLVQDEDGYWFDLGDGILVQSAESRSLSGEPEISLYELNSTSWYMGTSIHFRIDSFYAGCYFRYGMTDINSQIDTNLDEYVGSLKRHMPDEYKAFLNQFPLNLNRTETYQSVGGYLNFPVFYGLRGDFEYSYIKLLRDRGLDYEQSNYSITAALIYDVTDKIGLNFGGEYLYRQLNGVVPFMYNKYTQTTFDHKYGYIFSGISYKF